MKLYDQIQWLTQRWGFGDHPTPSLQLSNQLHKRISPFEFLTSKPLGKKKKKKPLGKRKEKKKKKIHAWLQIKFNCLHFVFLTADVKIITSSEIGVQGYVEVSPGHCYTKKLKTIGPKAKGEIEVSVSVVKGGETHSKL